jgi:hypothetical protein
MAAAFTPTRRYGLHGDTCYFTQTMLTEDGDHIWQVFVMRPRSDALTGEYWYEDCVVAAIRTRDLDREQLQAHDAAIDAAQQFLLLDRQTISESDLKVEQLMETADELDPCAEFSGEADALCYVLTGDSD